jgi:anion-transporting  ArsA/GET3 family ATPase
LRGIEHFEHIFVVPRLRAKFWQSTLGTRAVLHESAMPADSLLPLLQGKRIVVCAGAGGVGKTTVAASIALGFASRGQRVLCITIDPAKRLADSLGLGTMNTEEQVVSPALFSAAGIAISGSLTVLMLDTKRTFDDLVARHASSAEARERIFQNRIYSYVSTSLAGTQSYMAMEKVLLVHQDPRFDVIVLDTPPTSNALDFLDAPERLIEAIDSAAMRWLVQTFEKSGRFSLNLVARGVALVLRGLGRLTGKGFLEHLAEFVAELNELFGGFRERASIVAKAFRSPELSYVLVTSAAPAAIDEVSYFSARLREQGMHPDAVVINRLQPSPGAADALSVQAAARALGVELTEHATTSALQAAADDRRRARFESKQLALLGQALGPSAPKLFRVPTLAADVHDVRSLFSVAACLFPT